MAPARSPIVQTTREAAPPALAPAFAKPVVRPKTKLQPTPQVAKVNTCGPCGMG
ncbi:MAG: hypothetical protein ABI867_36885 [Kofleriaceae bacterium]